MLNDENIIVYPSPIIHEVNISFAGISEDNFRLSIFDISGKLLFERKVELLSNNRIETINISNFAGGVYFVKIQGLLSVVTKKVVKE
jgi:hypothetical protein